MDSSDLFETDCDRILQFVQQSHSDGGEIGIRWTDDGAEIYLGKIGKIQLTKSVEVEMTFYSGMCPSWVETRIFNVDNLFQEVISFIEYLGALAHVSDDDILTLLHGECCSVSKNGKFAVLEVSKTNCFTINDVKRVVFRAPPNIGSCSLPKSPFIRRYYCTSASQPVIHVEDEYALLPRVDGAVVIFEKEKYGNTLIIEHCDMSGRDSVSNVLLDCFLNINFVTYDHTIGEFVLGMTNPDVIMWNDPKTPLKILGVSVRSVWYH